MNESRMQRNPWPFHADDAEDLPPVGTRERATALAARRRRRVAYGRRGPYDRVPADDVRRVITTLREHGFTYDRIGEIFDFDPVYVHRILARHTYVFYQTHQHIMSFDVEQIIRSERQSNRRIPAGPYRDLLRRYLAAGWSMNELVEIAGPPLSRESQIWRSRAKYVTPEMADTLDKMNATLGERVKPNPTSRDRRVMTRTRKNGYQPPAYYDDERDTRSGHH